jgi:hypothetical protein
MVASGTVGSAVGGTVVGGMGDAGSVTITGGGTGVGDGVEKLQAKLIRTMTPTTNANLGAVLMFIPPPQFI